LARRREIASVYAAAVSQGVALVTFPAASAVFTSPRYFGLSSTAYGAMFLPQAVMAVAAPLTGAWLGRRLGIKRVYLLGLMANLAAMGLLVASQFMRGTPLVYGLLLLATGSLGIGFGLTVPALNTYANAFFRDRADSAVLVLNALLGAGTALAPVLVTFFVKLGIWWGLPLFVAALLLGLLAFSLSLPLRLATDDREGPGQAHGAVRPPRFSCFSTASSRR